VTKYRVVRRKKDYTILEVEPITGRTNQIRIHLAAIGHPLLGERVYAFRRDFKVKFRRVALHASGIRFTHPFTKEEMSFVSELPRDLEELVNG
jgi:23S rRNA pseudouridine1911/1915/1917 synthase